VTAHVLTGAALRWATPPILTAGVYPTNVSSNVNLMEDKEKLIIFKLLINIFG
jgi:hypothetical protein